MFREKQDHEVKDDRAKKHEAVCCTQPFLHYSRGNGVSLMNIKKPYISCTFQKLAYFRRLNYIKLAVNYLHTMSQCAMHQKAETKRTLIKFVKYKVATL